MTAALARARLLAQRTTSTGSVLWFASLGYGARWLAPLFARPKAWRVLDTLTGAMMLVLAWWDWQGMAD